MKRRKDLVTTIGMPDIDHPYSICLSCDKSRRCTLSRTIDSSYEMGIVIVKKCNGINKDD